MRTNYRRSSHLIDHVKISATSTSPQRPQWYALLTAERAEKAPESAETPLPIVEKSEFPQTIAHSLR
jgi:hypothetical protein